VTTGQARVTVDQEGFSLEEKRCYLPVIIACPCPLCGTDSATDLRDSYLSYPTLGKDTPIAITCSKDDCEHAMVPFYVQGQMRITFVVTGGPMTYEEMKKR